MLSKKTFGLQKKLCEVQKKNVQDKIVHLKNIYKYSSGHFLIGHVLFVLIVKNVIKNEIFHFAPNLCEIRKNCSFPKGLQINN